MRCAPAIFLICALAVGGCQTVSPNIERPAKKTPLSAAALSGSGNEILASDMSFDMYTGEIKYTLPEEALVRIRIGIKNGGAMLRTLLDWEHRSAGPHTEIWDKKDATGKVDFSAHENLMLVLSCLPPDPARQRQQTNIKGLRHSPRLRVSFPGAPENAQNQAVLSGIVPMRVTIDPEDAKWLTETKYELGVFIDNVFLAEDEEGVNPYTYQFNTKGLNNGTHTITANILGYEGEIGTESVVVEIKN